MTETPRTVIALPGFRFDFHGENSRAFLPVFGAGVAFDVYRRTGGITPELRKMSAEQCALHPEDPQARSIMYSRHGNEITVFVRVDRATRASSPADVAAENVAERVLGISLDEVGRNAHDFHELHVAKIREALKAAYEAGRAAR